MNILSLKKKTFVPTTAITLAIDTSGVSASIFQKNETGVEFLWNKHNHIESDEAMDTSTLLRKTKDALEKTLISLQKKHSLYPPECPITLLLGSPWHISYQENVSFSKDKVFTVTEKIVSDAIKESFKKSHPDLSTLSIRIISFHSNGYTLPSIIGQSVKEFDVKVHVETTSLSVRASFESILDKYFIHSSLSYGTLSFAAAEAVKTTLKEEDFLLLLPSFETTEAILVEKGGVSAIAVLPFGTAHISRKLFPGGSHVFEMMNHTRRLLSGEITAEEKARTDAILEAEKEVFLKNLRDATWQMSSSFSTSGKIVIYGRTSAAKILSLWLRDAKFLGESFRNIDDTAQIVGSASILRLAGAEKAAKHVSLNASLEAFYEAYLKKRD